MKRVRKLAISLILIFVVAVNSGCVAIFAAGVVTGAGQYVNYTLNSIANQTFMGDLQHVTSVSINVLKEMKIKIRTVERYEDGTRIFAATKNLNIRISMDPISVNTTRVSIDVSKYTVLRDKATASAIILQIDTFLTNDNQRLARRTIQ